MISLGLYSNGIVELKETTIGSSYISIPQTVYNWINPNERVLLDIDAPWAGQ